MPRAVFFILMQNENLRSAMKHEQVCKCYISCDASNTRLRLFFTCDCCVDCRWRTVSTVYPQTGRHTRTKLVSGNAQSCHLPAMQWPCIMRPAIGDIPAAKNALQGLRYRCAHCTSEFASRPAMDCHRRHPNSVETPCADPNNSKSMSFTARASVSS